MKNGKYYFSVKNFQEDSFDRYETEVEILDETEKSFKIKFLENIVHYPKGYVTWVKKKNVKIHQEVDYSNAWWNK